MSVCGQTEEESASEEPPAGAPVRDMYEQKAVSKVVRVLTVLAYLLSVSLAAILLSVYYVCVWQSPKLPPLNDTDADGQFDALRANRHDYYNNHTQHYNHSRGSNTSVSDVVPSPPAQPTSLPPAAASSEPPDDPTPPDPSTTADYNVTWLMPNITFNATDER